MSLTVPKIVYPAGAATHNFTFVYPPRHPGDPYMATRHDNVASSGAVEIVYERTDIFLVVYMENVKEGTDLDNWKAFMADALTGILFSYYPDSTNSAHLDCVLAETEFRPKRKSLAMYEFTTTFRVLA